MNSNERNRVRFQAIREHGESVVHFHPCRGCGEPIFVAWSDTGQSLQWVAFDRSPDAPVKGETYIVTKTKMRLVRHRIDARPKNAAYWPHDCRNPAFGVGAQAARMQKAGGAV